MRKIRKSILSSFLATMLSLAGLTPASAASMTTWSASGLTSILVTFDCSIGGQYDGTRYTVSNGSTSITGNGSSASGNQLTVTFPASLPSGSLVLSYDNSSWPTRCADNTLIPSFSSIPEGSGQGVSDTVAPFVQSATVDATGQNLLITFSEAMSSKAFSMGEWRITVNGQAMPPLNAPALNYGVTSLNIDLFGNSVPTVQQGDVVLLAHVAGAPYRDIASNALADFSGFSVTNNSAYSAPVLDQTAPTVLSATIDSTGSLLTVVFDEAMDATSLPATMNNGWVLFNLDTATLEPFQLLEARDISMGGTTLVIDIATPVRSGVNYELWYDPQAAFDPYEDTSTNSLLGFGPSGEAVINNSSYTPDITPPTVTLVSVASDGLTVNISYTEAMQADSSCSGFSVRRSALPLTLTSCVTSGQSTQIVLANPSVIYSVDSVQSLQLWYEAPGNLRDAAGNFLGFFSQGSARNFDANLSTVSVQQSPQQPQQPATLVSGPTLALNGDSITSVNAAWSSGASTLWLVLACSQQISAGSTTVQLTVVNTVQTICQPLSSSSLGQTRPTSMSGVYVLGNNGYELYSSSGYSSTHRHIMTYATISGTNWAWSATQLLGSVAPVASSSSDEVPPPVYYGGPKITGFSKPASIGSSLGGDIRLEGKRMAKVTSATIGGVAAEFVSTRTSLRVTVPTGLKPGTYDLVLQTSSGKITILRFVTIAPIN